MAIVAQFRLKEAKEMLQVNAIPDPVGWIQKGHY